ncbi:27055_t:CDS:2 [Dentiscutata erythropus]|uniref:27055_t:CDS:1 n=1 Tax=Dentiscutata erythropus TaxID=1348616 RepID=A0A9N9BDI9_9GLOM|nr:27055_t:CDS:2 [Dentiscutata erythropus]
MPHDPILTQNSNRPDNFEKAQKIENSDIEMHNSLSQYNEEDSSTINENILSLIRSNKQSFSYKTSTSSLDRHIQARYTELYNDFHQTTLNRYLRLTPYPHNIQEKKFRHILLDIFEIPFPHTGQAISNIILSLLDKYKLENKILTLTSNNASNIILASNLVKTMLANDFSNTLFQPVRCAAYIINLAVKEGLKSPFNTATEILSKSNYPTIADLRLIISNLSANSNNITQPLSTSKRLQFIYEYAGISMPIANSTSDKLTRYWETIALPEEISICDW